MDTSLREFLETTHIGVVSTDGPHGMESAAVYFVADDALTIYFNTRTESRKFENILEKADVSFVAFTENPARTLQITGRAEEIKTMDETMREQYVSLLGRTLHAHSKAPIEQIGSMIRFIKITPTWARFSDFSGSENGQGKEFHMLVGGER